MLHRAGATPGYDEELALRLVELAAGDRLRRGYAAASALQERAARLDPSPGGPPPPAPSAVEDALLAGDVDRGSAALASTVLTPRRRDGAARARALLGLGCWRSTPARSRGPATPNRAAGRERRGRRRRPARRRSRRGRRRAAAAEAGR